MPASIVTLAKIEDLKCISTNTIQYSYLTCSAVQSLFSDTEKNSIEYMLRAFFFSYILKTNFFLRYKVNAFVLFSLQGTYRYQHVNFPVCRILGLARVGTRKSFQSQKDLLIPWVTRTGQEAVRQVENWSEGQSNGVTFSQFFSTYRMAARCS